MDHLSEVEAAELKAFNNEVATMISHERDTMYPIGYGSLYDREMSSKEAAAEIRKTLRKLSKAKHSPLYGATVSVRYRSYSGGRAIDVRLEVPFRVKSTEEEQMEYRSRDEFVRRYWLTDKARAAYDVAEEVHSAYNFDGSNSQVDYFHVNYYGSVDIEEKGAES